VSKHHNKERSALQNKYHINDRIKADQLRVITDDGENLGVISRREALDRAQEAGLDLVEIGMHGDIVIAKIMDFGKFLYLKKKQQAEAKKKQKIIQIKEIKMRPNIGDQDYLVKFRHAVQFLNEGKHVKFTVQFRGRQMAMKHELGRQFFDRIHKDLLEQDLGTLVEEKEQKSRPFWSKTYYIKEK